MSVGEESLHSAAGTSWVSLGGLGAVPHFWGLCAAGVKVTDSSWGNLAMLVSLQELELRGSNASNEVVKSLQDLAQLQRLSLRQTKINDGALPFLLSLKGGLTSLDLSDNDIRGEPAAQQAWGGYPTDACAV